jgi:hypothetical protein
MLISAKSFSLLIKRDIRRVIISPSTIPVLGERFDGKKAVRFEKVGNALYIILVKPVQL